MRCTVNRVGSQICSQENFRPRGLDWFWRCTERLLFAPSMLIIPIYIIHNGRGAGDEVVDHGIHVVMRGIVPKSRCGFATKVRVIIGIEGGRSAPRILPWLESPTNARVSSWCGLVPHYSHLARIGLRVDKRKCLERWER